MQSEGMMAITEWECMITDKMLINLFSEQSDGTMSRVALEILSSSNPTMAALRKKVEEIETLLWYSTKKNLGKLGMQKRFFKPCNSSSHWEVSCWGECRICHLSGHKAEWCHLARKGGTPPTTSTSTEAAKAGMEKKKKKKKKKKEAKKARDAAAGTETPMEEVDTESDSQADSPVRPVLAALSAENARAEGVNLGTSNKAYISGCLKSILNNMRKEEAQDCFEALRANNRESPMTKTKVFGILTGGYETDTWWDSGCTFAIATLQIIMELGGELQPSPRS